MDLLSTRVRAVCFVRVPTTRIRLVVPIACIAVAATLGGLVVLGAARGGASALFAMAGWALTPAVGDAPATVLGVAVHGLWIALWSLLYASVARAHRGWRVLGDAVAVAGLAGVVATLVGPALAGPSSLVGIAERVLLHVILALALAAGMRLARTW
jgi:hypothetical protein